MTTDRGERKVVTLLAFWRDERAATSVEYALIGVVMAIGLLAAIVPLRSELAAMFTSVAVAVENALAG